MKLFSIPTYQLYLLQLENYELGRYFRLLFQKGLWPRGEQRKSLVWTSKARTIFSLSLVSHLLGLFFVFFSFLKSGLSVLSIMYLVLWCAVLFLYCILYTLFLILLKPLDAFLKFLIVARAKAKLAQYPNIKIIGIAGSYGKTTMKQVLTTVLNAQLSVISPGESINTPVGVGRWILRSVEGKTEIIIVEMGEHYRGDVAALCRLTRPDIAVVTGINEAHLERMKTSDTVTETIFEIVSNAKPGANILINGDDKRVMESYKKFAGPDHAVQEYQATSIKQQVFDQQNLCWVGSIESIGQIKINLLGHYALGDVDAAIKIAQLAGMDSEHIRLGIGNIKPVEHRLQAIHSGQNILVIDDSYNGNPQGVAEAIKVLSRFENRRKIFITPGLVETGKSATEVHREIGRQLAEVADVVILIKNSVTQDIELGIKNYESGTGNQPDIIWFNTAQEAHASLGKILQPNDVIVFQNDWGDQYL